MRRDRRSGPPAREHAQHRCPHGEHTLAGDWRAPDRVNEDPSCGVPIVRPEATEQIDLLRDLSEAATRSRASIDDVKGFELDRASVAPPNKLRRQALREITDFLPLDFSRRGSADSTAIPGRGEGEDTVTNLNKRAHQIEPSTRRKYRPRHLSELLGDLPKLDGAAMLSHSGEYELVHFAIPVVRVLGPAPRAGEQQDSIVPDNEMTAAAAVAPDRWKEAGPTSAAIQDPCRPCVGIQVHDDVLATATRATHHQQAIMAA